LLTTLNYTQFEIIITVTFFTRKNYNNKNTNNDVADEVYTDSQRNIIINCVFTPLALMTNLKLCLPCQSWNTLIYFYNNKIMTTDIRVHNIIILYYIMNYVIIWYRMRFTNRSCVNFHMWKIGKTWNRVRICVIALHTFRPTK